jgi:glycosyltransferase involved in cell wall biosynthesis
MSRPLELVVLTSEFPYGTVSEPFLETEIEVLASRFERIYVIPSARVQGTRPLPSNVELIEMDWLQEPSSAAKRRALASPSAARILAGTLLAASDPRPYFRDWRTYSDILAKNILKSISLARLIRERQLDRAIFYDYWFENSTLAIGLLRRTKLIKTAISRAHRFDLYDEAWRGGVVPFRDVKAGWLDAIFAVSAYGHGYLAERLPRSREKLRLSRLGVRDPGRAGPPPSDPVPVIVTCARLEPTKCIHLVPETLNRVDGPLRWIHLGDGPERERVVSAASKLTSRTRWELRGQIENREVLRFYERQHVDAFLSLSSSEGLPVSMMEAQSYGIPVAARAVHGIPEIVTTRTGVQLPIDVTPTQAADGLATCLEQDRFNPDDVRAFFAEHYDAITNYNTFADALIALSKSKIPPA